MKILTNSDIEALGKKQKILEKGIKKFIIKATRIK